MQPMLPSAPPAIAAALDRLKTDLSNSAGNNLAGLILYGGLSRGRYRPGKSDVNVVVLLREATSAVLAAIAPALRTARRAANVVPLILTLAEVPAAARVFPTKFLDIKEHHVVLLGEDPFAGLDVPREQLSWRAVQELRNLSLRLRHRFVADAGDADAQAASLTVLARPLAIQLIGLLRLAGKEVPKDDRTAAVFEAAATAFDLDGAALASLAALRQGERVPGDVTELFGRMLAVLARATAEAERLKEVPR
jgi:hypothetical protein